MAGKAAKGAKTYKIVAEVELDQESLAAAQQEAAEGVAAAASSSADAAPRSERSRGGGARDATPKAAQVDAKVNAKVEGKIRDDIQGQLDKDFFDISIDVGNVRASIEEQLKQPFVIKLAAAGQMAFDEKHGPAISTGAPVGRGAPPDDLLKALSTKGMREAIDNLYRNINEAFAAAGKGKFGSQSTALGNQAEKIAEIVEAFGGKFEDLLQIDKNSPIGKVTGGKLSPRELGEALGIDPNSPVLTTVQEGVKALTGTTKEGGISTRSAELLISRAANWVGSTPVGASPAAAAEQTAEAITKAMRQEGGGVPAAAATSATPAMDRLAQAAKTLRAELGKVPFQDVSLAIPRREVENKGVARTDDDPEATAQAIDQLLPNQRGGRGLIGRAQARTINGISTDVEDLLQDLRSGTAFQNIFQTKETKTSPSRLIQLQPKTEEEEARARELSRSRRQVTIEGVGRATPLGPTQALRQAIVERYDEQIADVLFSDPQFANLVRLSAQEGSRAKQAREPGMPVPGSGEAGGVTWASGHGPQAGYQAAFRLAETQAELEHQYRRLEDLQGTGKPTTRVEEKIAQLEARESRLIESAAPLVGATPDEARAMAAAASARGAENRDRIADDVGLTQEEVERKAMRNPKLLGQRAKEMFGGTAFDPNTIAEAIDAKLKDQDWVAGQTGGTNAVIGAAIKEVLDPLRAALPDKGPIKQEAERSLFPAVYRSYFGERERVMRSNIDDSRGVTTERRGGITQINEEASNAVDRAEGGRGRGRVAREVGNRLTHGQTDQGRPKTEPVLDRPTTDLDLEMMTLAARIDRQASIEKQQQDEARRAAELEGERRFPVPTSTAGPKAPVPGAKIQGVRSREDQKAYEAFVTRSTASRLGRLPDSEVPGMHARLRDLRGARRDSDATLAMLAQTTGGMSPEQQRVAAMVSTTSPDVHRDVIQSLEARTAEAARSAATRGSKDPQTGAEAAARFKKAGGVIAGDSETIPPNPNRRERTDVAAWHERLATMGLAGGGGGAGGRPPAATGGSGGFDDISGPVHVIIDGQPIQVSFAGAAPSGVGVTGQQAAVGARDDATKARAALRRFTSDQNLKFVNEFIEKQRGEGKSDTQIKGALRAFGFGGVAALALDDPESASGGTGVLRGRNARRERLGLSPLVARDEGFFASVDKADQERSRLAAEARAAERAIPKRGFTASVTDIFSNLGGLLDKQVAAVNRFSREGQQLASLQAKGPGIRANAETLSQEFEAARTLREETQAKIESLKATKGNEREVKALSKTLRATTKDFNDLTRENDDAQRKLQEYNVELKEQSDRTSEARRALPGAGGRMAAFGIGFGAAAGAVAVGQLVAQVAQAVTGAIGTAVGPAFERATGFAGTTGRVTSAAADTLRQAGGDRGAVSGSFAATGVSAMTTDRIGGFVIDRAEVEAGNKAIKEQIDFLHTAQNLQRDRGEFGQFDKGLSQTTGGWVGTQLFGVPSTAELLKNELNAIPGADQRDQQRGQLNEIATLMAVASPTSDALDELSKGASSLVAELARADTTVGLFNEQAAKGGSALKLVENAALAEKSAALARSAGLDEFAASLEKSGFGVSGASSPEDIQSFLASVNRGSVTPDVRLLLEATQRERQARAGRQQQQLDLNLTQLGPQQSALANAQQGFGSYGGTAPTGASGVAFGKGDSPKVMASINRELAITADLYGQVNASVDEGIASMRTFVSDPKSGFNPAQVADFNSALDKSLGYAKDIAAVQIGLETKQANYQAAQFSYQIGLVKRNLADAKGLVSGVGNSLGALERQMFDLQRESQALGLGMSQKQINFQTAIAGFTAPGLTGEERAARIKQAKIEADYAQKQLDIQKKLFGLQGTQFDKTASRSVSDLQKQLGLLEQGRSITLETAAAEKRIKALTALQEKENKKVTAYYETAIMRTADIMDEEAKLVAATGKALIEITDDVISAFVRTYRSITGAISGSLEKHEEGAGGLKGGRAAGGSVMAGSSYWVGEHSKELFTPEENGRITPLSMIPQITPMGGQQTGSTYQIIVQGNKFTSEDEEARILRKVTQAVKDAQGRELALRGMRFGG